MKKLSIREAMVLDQLVQGKTTDEIASYLQISKAFAEKCLTSAYLKLNVRNRTEAAVLCVKHRILDEYFQGVA